MALNIPGSSATARAVGRSALILAVSLGCLSAASHAPGEGSTKPDPRPQEADPPALIVLMMIDQLRGDLLEEYGDLFSGGLRRLMDEGRWYRQATHDHGITETSPGHASIATGTYPARHGMVSNIWYTQDANGTWSATLNVVDPTVRLVGGQQYQGSSPNALQRSGLADWLLDTDDDAKVFSVAGKDRAAILLASQTKSHVYWFEPTLGRFATSTYYRDDDPKWIREFNEDMVERISTETRWDNEVPPEWVSRARADSATFERDGVDVVFPHVFEADSADQWAFATWWNETPYPDREVLALARRAVHELELGEDDTTDLLSISLSQVDWVGHDFGPRSLEQLDNLLRLDRELGEFLEYLETRFGDRFILAFSADHGTVDAPEALAAQGTDARRLVRADGEALNEVAGAILREKAAEGMEVLAGALAEGIRETDWIADAWPTSELGMAAEQDSLAKLMGRSSFPGRVTGLVGRFGVTYRLEPRTILWAIPFGSTHGSPYLYDRHVPIIFFGHGVTPGVIDGRAATVQIAPTLAEFAGLEYPDDLDGTPLWRR